ncbi:Metallo-beta-lactamase superfamily protein [Halogranum amylolyticum]|uniref:Metallo-beta-lactamase superfamily protein n=1 Tax=Halogranum amylolyticum TaxID=660520 RepID=A0A1H8QFR8_9EURY|nr:MBL fold metallo-hydrolase [Halogranum amylolyticum]SEO52896.1 Metallo-beta-lactamase superfamily protein [Halogranum amylolyticum]
MEVFNVTADAEQFTCNAYLLTGERTVLVDVGSMPGVADVVADHVDHLDAIVLTHQHSDHVDQLEAVLDRFDADVYAYADHPHRTHALEADDTVAMGDETFEVVYTPGHAADHVSFVGETALFSGDVVVYNDGAYDDGSFGRTDLPGQSRERLIQSLRDLLEHLPDSVTTLYAGHGDSFTADPAGDSVRDVVERALARAEERQLKYPDE